MPPVCDWWFLTSEQINLLKMTDEQTAKLEPEATTFAQVLMPNYIGLDTLKGLAQDVAKTYPEGIDAIILGNYIKGSRLVGCTKLECTNLEIENNRWKLTEPVIVVLYNTDTSKMGSCECLDKALTKIADKYQTPDMRITINPISTEKYMEYAGRIPFVVSSPVVILYKSENFGKIL